MHGQGKGDALIIGGSGGIGAAISLVVARMGYNLYIHGGRNEKALRELCRKAEGFGVAAKGFLSEFHDTKQFVASIPEGINPEILVVSFGPMKSLSLEKTTDADWAYLVDANLTMPGTLVSRFGPAMAERGFGRIVLFGSSNSDSIRGYKEIAAYAAAKTGLGVLAKSAARQWGKRNVTCNVICPGYVMTEYSNADLHSHGMEDAAQSPEDMAEIAASLLKREFSDMNGAILSCTRGL